MCEALNIGYRKLKLKVELQSANDLELQVNKLFLELLLHFFKGLDLGSTGSFAMSEVVLDELKVASVGVVYLASEEETESREHVPIELSEGVLLLVDVEDSVGSATHLVLDLECLSHLLDETYAFTSHLEFFDFTYATGDVCGHKVVLEIEKLH